jgi:AraC family transcriptional regulator, transcriptional activator FtrA
VAHKVAVVVFDGLAPFELGIVIEVFGLPRDDLVVPWWYEVAVCAERIRPLAAVGGFTIVPAHGLSEVAHADTVIVPAWPRSLEPVPPKVVAALRAAHTAGARLVSICSGAFVLAATGLLDGRRAATHWRYASALRGLYPAVRVDEKVLYVDDGDILTSAGSAAGLDPCLHIVRCDHGAEVANHLARRLVIAPHRAGDQAQFIERPVVDAHDQRLRQAMDWALSHIAEPITLTEFAHRAFMSPRTLTRRFGEAVREPPIAWLMRQRVDASLPLLENSDLGIEQIARAVGFSTAAGYRKYFRRHLSRSPTGYRQTYRAPGAAGLRGISIMTG